MVARASLSAQRGFTLTELMIVLTIAGILAAFALPAFRDMMLNQKLKTASLDLYSNLTLARSEAIKRNASVSVFATGGDWQTGYTVCFDANSDGDCADASDVVVATQDAMEASITLSNASGATTVTFSRDGRLSTTGAGSFRISAGTNAVATPLRCVEIDISGRARTKADTNATDSDGCN